MPDSFAEFGSATPLEASLVILALRHSVMPLLFHLSLHIALGKLQVALPGLDVWLRLCANTLFAHCSHSIPAPEAMLMFAGKQRVAGACDASCKERLLIAGLAV